MTTLDGGSDGDCGNTIATRQSTVVGLGFTLGTESISLNEVAGNFSSATLGAKYPNLFYCQAEFKVSR
jgi:hypothetical protein